MNLYSQLGNQSDLQDNHIHILYLPSNLISFMENERVFLFPLWSKYMYVTNYDKQSIVWLNQWIDKFNILICRKLLQYAAPIRNPILNWLNLNVKQFND
jgi:hypothetical protein